MTTFTDSEILDQVAVFQPPSHSDISRYKTNDPFDPTMGHHTPAGPMSFNNRGMSNIRSNTPFVFRNDHFNPYSRYYSNPYINNYCNPESPYVKRDQPIEFSASIELGKSNLNRNILGIDITEELSKVYRDYHSWLISNIEKTTGIMDIRSHYIVESGINDDTEPAPLVKIVVIRQNYNVASGDKCVLTYEALVRISNL